jgi:protein O-GlcNAc transferase
MAILNRTPASVLWLLEGHPRFRENIRREAEARGVAGDRIIFATLLSNEKHLARLRLADLFLDTLPCNAHTTASDALWAGLPLITCRGSAFSGHVAASLLGAIGLSDLVTETLDGYEALAVRLAGDAVLLRQVRDRLARNRLTTPLFDTDAYRRHLEAAYQTMVETHESGLLPRSFTVARTV